jgi:hypothetical protein
LRTAISPNIEAVDDLPVAYGGEHRGTAFDRCEARRHGEISGGAVRNTAAVSPSLPAIDHTVDTADRTVGSTDQ